MWAGGHGTYVHAPRFLRLSHATGEDASRRARDGHADGSGDGTATHLMDGSLAFFPLVGSGSDMILHAYCLPEERSTASFTTENPPVPSVLPSL